MKPFGVALRAAFVIACAGIALGHHESTDQQVCELPRSCNAGHPPKT